MASPLSYILDLLGVKKLYVSGSAQTYRNGLDLVAGSGVTLTPADDAAADTMRVTVAASGSSGLPSPTGNALEILRVKGDESGYETVPASTVGISGALNETSVPHISGETAGLTGGNATISGLMDRNIAIISGRIGPLAISSGNKGIAFNLNSIMPAGRSFSNNGDGGSGFFAKWTGATITKNHPVRVELLESSGTNMARVSFFDADVNAYTSGDYTIIFTAIGTLADS